MREDAKSEEIGERLSKGDAVPRLIQALPGRSRGKCPLRMMGQAVDLQGF